VGRVECPRCGRVTEAAGIWLWVDGQGERLRVENGSIQQSGHVSVFDLACGCKFDTELWRLSAQTSVSLRGGSFSVRVTPIAAVPAAITGGGNEHPFGFTEEGFISDETKPAEALTFWTPILSCDACGALVTVHGVDRHRDWHTRG
jgi:hypothetical protein